MVKVGERNTPSSLREKQALLAAGSVRSASTGRVGSPTTKSPAGLGAVPKASSWADQPAKSPAEKSAKVSTPERSGGPGVGCGKSARTDRSFFSKEVFGSFSASSFTQ